MNANNRWTDMKSTCERYILISAFVQPVHILHTYAEQVMQKLFASNSCYYKKKEKTIGIRAMHL